ncbi:hypothetical protein B0T26DRAFT_733718 [Lasiosphaeria miniovina]|uniref:Uncharacterized protein n=1 Tax=Lasiosphaeria miniovina TaxID=1954250 RepID=A0AA39ZV14_9PEZI|nr:uncharacterized protein B0T26DRAFT_733718 [Lasiosphaeria miniovina]KAK0704035.1 hypothetical protein B0T26DRAFT_733718 [Lasiosphaeria miniovina]
MDCWGDTATSSRLLDSTMTQSITTLDGPSFVSYKLEFYFFFCVLPIVPACGAHGRVACRVTRSNWNQTFRRVLSYVFDYIFGTLGAVSMRMKKRARRRIRTLVNLLTV